MWYDMIKKPVQLIDYVHVYTGESKDGSLEKIFEELNVNHPSDYYAASLSISDLIQIDNKFFYVDGFGFKNIKSWWYLI